MNNTLASIDGKGENAMASFLCKFKSVFKRFCHCDLYEVWTQEALPCTCACTFVSSWGWASEGCGLERGVVTDPQRCGGFAHLSLLARRKHACRPRWRRASVCGARQRGGGGSKTQGKGEEWNCESQRIRILKIVPLCNLLLLMLQKAFLKRRWEGKERGRGRE